MDFFLWKLQVENLHILHQSNEFLHIFVEPFIFLHHNYEINGDFQLFQWEFGTSLQYDCSLNLQLPYGTAILSIFLSI